MKVLIDDNKIVLDDKLTIEEVGGAYTFNGTMTFGVGYQQGSSLRAEPDYSTIKDPYEYQSYSSNGYSVAGSAEKAAEKIENDFDSYGTVESDFEHIYDACKKLILDAKGRHTCYAIAGNVIKFAKLGYYKGLPLSFVFLGLVENKIQFPSENESAPESTRWLTFNG